MTRLLSISDELYSYLKEKKFQRRATSFDKLIKALLKDLKTLKENSKEVENAQKSESVDPNPCF